MYIILTPQTNSNSLQVNISRERGTIVFVIIYITLHHLQQYSYSWCDFHLRDDNTLKPPCGNLYKVHEIYQKYIINVSFLIHNL